MLVFLTILVILSALFLGAGIFVWREALKTFRMVGNALDEDRKLLERSTPSVSIKAPNRLLQKVSESKPKILTKDERRQMIQAGKDSPEFLERIRQINERREKYLKQMKPSRKFNPGQAFKIGQPLKDMEGLEPLEPKQEKAWPC